MSGSTPDLAGELIKIRPTPGEIRKATDGLIERLDALVIDGQTTRVTEPLPDGYAETSDHTVKDIRDGNGVLIYRVTRDIFPDLAGLMHYNIGEYEPGREDFPIDISSLDRESSNHPINVERMFCPKQDAELTVVKNSKDMTDHRLSSYTGKPLEAFGNLLTKLETLAKPQEQAA